MLGKSSSRLLHNTADITVYGAVYYKVYSTVYTNVPNLVYNTVHNAIYTKATSVPKVSR